VVLGVPLAAAPALLAAACTGGSGSGELTPAQVAVGDQARSRALAGEQELIARYDAALLLPEVSGDPALKERLTGVRAEHAAHVSALLEGTRVGGTPVGIPTPSVASPSPTVPASETPSGGPASSAASAGPPPPMDAKTAVAGLVKAEQDAATRLTADVLGTEGRTAQLLASISASESGHAALLLGGAS
jgi:hypothetical protein